MTHIARGSARRKAWPVALALAFTLSNLLSVGVGRMGQAGGVVQTSQAQAAPTPDGGQRAAVGQPVAPKQIQIQWSKTMPTPSAQERRAEQAAMDAERRLKVPIGPIHKLTAAETAALTAAPRTSTQATST